MKILPLRCLSVLVLVLALFAMAKAGNEGSPQEKDGKLVVVVTWGDLNNTPATDVYVEAHGFVPKYHSEKAYVLKISRPVYYVV